jgi:hypothetical protein
VISPKEAPSHSAQRLDSGWHFRQGEIGDIREAWRNDEVGLWGPPSIRVASTDVMPATRTGLSSQKMTNVLPSCMVGRQAAKRQNFDQRSCSDSRTIA